MKAFFERHEAVLNVDDIRRFASILIRDLAGALDDYELAIHLLEEPERVKDLEPEVRKALETGRIYVEPGTDELYLPIIHQERPLALIKATPDRKRTKSRDAVDLLPILIRSTLDKILLYKINIQDRETGFYNEDYFRTYIGKNLEAWQGPAPEAGQLKPLSLETREAPNR